MSTRKHDCLSEITICTAIQERLLIYSKMFAYSAGLHASSSSLLCHVVQASNRATDSYYSIKVKTRLVVMLNNIERSFSKWSLSLCLFLLLPIIHGSLNG